MNNERSALSVRASGRRRVGAIADQRCGVPTCRFYSRHAILPASTARACAVTVAMRAR